MILIHKKAIKSILPALLDSLKEAGVFAYLEASIYDSEKPCTALAGDQEFFKEFLEKKLTIWPVSSMQEAIDLIHKNGSGHTDCIITENSNVANAFLEKVDSAGVYWNASTR